MNIFHVSYKKHTALLIYFFLLSCKLHCLIGHIYIGIVKYIGSPRKDMSEMQVSGIIL